MLRDRLREMDLRITELSEYLQVSRPTMYKYIDSYDNAEFDLINKKVLKLFNYIQEHELAGKKSVINYILNNLTTVKELEDDEETDIIKKIKKYIISNPESKKSQFLVTAATKDTFDDIIFYLVSIQGLIKKRKLTDDELKAIKPYIEIKEKIKKLEGN